MATLVALLPVLLLLANGFRNEVFAMRTDLRTSAWERQDRSDAVAAARPGLGAGLSEGQLFDGRWLLQKKLDYFPSALSALNSSWDHPRRLGAGSFGEAWEATGEVNMGGRVKKADVVLKIFFRNVNRRVVYLTSSMLEQDKDARGEIESVKRECSVVQEIQRVAYHSKDVGTDRFVGCYSVELGSGDDPMYVVLGRGGKSLDMVLKEMDPDRPDHAKARIIMGGLLQAIRTMSERLPVHMTHHDLKPANAVFDGTTARLIDFGAVLTVEAGKEHQRSTSTPAYSAPEHIGIDSVAYSAPAWSYDVFALGMIYVELLCPAISQNERDWMTLVTQARAEWKDPNFAKWCRIPDEDLQLANRMMSFHPGLRPSPSAILSGKPFTQIAGSIGERGDSYSARDSGGSDLEQSVMFVNAAQMHVKNDMNGKVDVMEARKRLDQKKWAHGYECSHTSYEGQVLDSHTIEPQNSRETCGRMCAKFFSKHIQQSKDDGSLTHQLAGFDSKKRLCCELGYNIRTFGDRVCSVGYGGARLTAVRTGGKYAFLIPIDAPFLRKKSRK